jgi:hypothetical protein
MASWSGPIQPILAPQPTEDTSLCRPNQSERPSPWRNPGDAGSPGSAGLSCVGFSFRAKLEPYPEGKARAMIADLKFTHFPPAPRALNVFYFSLQFMGASGTGKRKTAFSAAASLMCDGSHICCRAAGLGSIHERRCGEILPAPARLRRLSSTNDKPKAYKPCRASHVSDRSIPSRTGHFNRDFVTRCHRRWCG